MARELGFSLASEVEPEKELARPFGSAVEREYQTEMARLCFFAFQALQFLLAQAPSVPVQRPEAGAAAGRPRSGDMGYAQVLYRTRPATEMFAHYVVSPRNTTSLRTVCPSSLASLDLQVLVEDRGLSDPLQFSGSEKSR